MNIRIVTDTVTLEELREIAQEFYAPMIKGVVDVENKVIAFGGEFHIDANTLLTEQGFEQKNIWGFNVHLDEPRDQWIVCTSLINIRPHDGNRKIEVEDARLCATIEEIVNAKII